MSNICDDCELFKILSARLFSKPYNLKHDERVSKSHFTHLCKTQHGRGGDGVAVERFEEALPGHGLAHGRLEGRLIPEMVTVYPWKIVPNINLTRI